MTYFKGLGVNQKDKDGMEDQWWISGQTMNHRFVNLVKNTNGISVLGKPCANTGGNSIFMELVTWSANVIF